MRHSGTPTTGSQYAQPQSTTTTTTTTSTTTSPGMSGQPSQSQPPPASRPALNRSTTVPLYFQVRKDVGTQDTISNTNTTQQQQYQNQNQHQRPSQTEHGGLGRVNSTSSMIHVDLADRPRIIGSRQSEGYRQDRHTDAAYPHTTPNTPITAHHQWHTRTPSIPALSSISSHDTSSSSLSSCPAPPTPQTAGIPSSILLSRPPTGSNGATKLPPSLSSPSSLSPPNNTLNPPSASTPTPTPTPTLLLRSSRAPRAAPQQHLKLSIQSTADEYVLSAPIGPGFTSEAITIAARRGNTLDIVADRWELEKDCHYEWQVQFDRDADMSSIKASYNAGVLRVTVRRVVYGSRDRPPHGHGTGR